MEEDNRILAISFEYRFINLSGSLETSGQPNGCSVYRCPATQTLPSFLTDCVVQMSKSFTESHQAIRKKKKYI